MLVAIGYIVILASVFGGYMLAGGHLGPLFQPTELLIIFGAGIGAFVVGNDKKAINATVKALPGLFKVTSVKVPARARSTPRPSIWK